jgi:hypothetical protein
MKYAYTFAAGVLVIIQGLLAFVVPAEQIAWMRWRVGAVIIAVLAVIALAMQLRKQAQKEKRAKEEQEKRERKRDRKIEELLQRYPKRGRAQDAAYDPQRVPVAPKETLAERTKQLAHEYYACLQEGAQVSVYESRLKPQLLSILPELQKSPIKVPITQSDIEPEKADLVAAMRDTADTLALAAIKMEYPKMKINGKYLVLDED